eukprot:Skav201426  [mRNA]  locus=scaffold201:177769:191713:- [translate_table: standard]
MDGPCSGQRICRFATLGATLEEAAEHFSRDHKRSELPLLLAQKEGIPRDAPWLAAFATHRRLGAAIRREMEDVSDSKLAKIAPAPSANAGGFARSESHISSSSAIIIEAEACRQRYKRLHPKDCADDEKDYKTLVHTLTQERLSAIFKTKMGEGACKTGLCGLKEEQARAYFNVYGKNEITPPKRENIWIKLQTFLGIFNILLWSCVIAEAATGLSRFDVGGC